MKQQNLCWYYSYQNGFIKKLFLLTNSSLKKNVFSNHQKTLSGKLPFILITTFMGELISPFGLSLYWSDKLYWQKLKSD